MPIRIRDAGNALRTVAALRMRDAGNALRTIQMIRMRDASNVLRTVYVAMAAAVNPSSVSGTRGSFGPGALSVTSNVATATPSGGTAPFTYAWSFVAGDNTIGATAPTSASTTFSASVPFGSQKSATFGVTVTDANGASAAAQVSVTLTHVDLN